MAAEPATTAGAALTLRKNRRIAAGYRRRIADLNLQLQLRREPREQNELKNERRRMVAAVKRLRRERRSTKGTT